MTRKLGYIGILGDFANSVQYGSVWSGFCYSTGTSKNSAILGVVAEAHFCPKRFSDHNARWYASYAESQF